MRIEERTGSKGTEVIGVAGQVFDLMGGKSAITPDEASLAEHMGTEAPEISERFRRCLRGNTRTGIERQAKTTPLLVRHIRYIGNIVQRAPLETKEQIGHKTEVNGVFLIREER